MADSDEDFGGFGTTTPAVSRRLPSAAGPSRQGGNAKRKGTSTFDGTDDEIVEIKDKSRAAGAAAKRRRKDDNQEVEQLEIDSDEVQEVEQPKAKGRSGSKKPASRSGGAVANGTKGAAATNTGKGKGKAKAKVQPSKGKTQEVEDEEAMDVDQPISVEGDDEEVDAAEELAGAINAAHRGPPSRGGGTRPPPPKPKPRSKAKEDEVAVLKEIVAQREATIETLKRQVEELCTVRMTEPEMLLERVEAQNEREREKADALIEDLTLKLQQKDPLMRGSKNVLQLLTRDEANRESQNLQEQIRNHKEAISQRDAIIDKLRKENEEQRQTEHDLRVELKAETDRSKGLAAKVAQDKSTFRSTPGGGAMGRADDPKIPGVIRFYEDLTNLLVPSIKPLTSKYFKDLDEWALTCMYSYRDVVNQDTTAKSLGFGLNLTYDRHPNLVGEPRSKDDLVESVHYTPHNLEKESSDFRESLGFLATQFSFQRDQLSLFLRQLYEVLSGENTTEEDSE